MIEKVARLLLILIATICATSVMAQTRTITGKVHDTNGEPIVGANIIVAGTSNGTITNFDGNYTLQLPEGANKIVVRFIGYTSQEITIGASNTYDVELKDESTELGDVVVVGYGTTKKGDLTGSVANVTADDFNKGLVSSPEQLINGKVAGVQIMSNSGSPSAGSSIKIRGGASLSASNDPLIVLDGVPLENGGISGNSSNFMALINPSDIESMTVLKDASSTAIYGSRASNGVILITTKKGAKDKLNVSLTTTHSLQVKDKVADFLSREEFIDVVKSTNNDTYINLIGEADTDWNEEIFRVAYGTDNNISISGRAGSVPMRLSIGYYNQNGILNTDNAQRISGNLNITPSLLDDHLKLNFGVKGTMNKNRFAPTGAIYYASRYNPTIPIKTDDLSQGAYYNGYTEGVTWIAPNAETGEAGYYAPENGALFNPVGVIEQTEDKSTIKRVIGNFDAEYKLHILPELKAHITFGYDYAEGKGTVKVDPLAAQYYSVSNGVVSSGRDYEYGPQKLTNELFTAYLNYNKVVGVNHIDATAGYDYQYWKSTSPYYETKTAQGNVISSIGRTDQRHVLLSYYGRLNYTLLDRYMVTATIRRDGTSRFSESERWGTFPSVALAWRVSEESFLGNIESLSNLKLRASYGITGQQEGIGNYAYQAMYTESQAGAGYVFGGKEVGTLRPEAYVANLKWETTKAWNFGIDFGFINNRINGSFDFYTRKTEDLLATVPSAAGTNFDKQILTNVGNVDSYGWEFNINGAMIQSEDWQWDASFNMSYQNQEVKNLSIVENGKITSTSVGPTIDSYYFQRLTEGKAPYMFYLYHQLYDDNGTPIEGSYADISGDGQINSDDLYHIHKPDPDFILGFSTSVSYKNITLATSLRANIGNYVYNGTQMNSGALGTITWASSQILNLSSSYLDTHFQDRQQLSDYYLENASFLKMDNISLSYNFGRLADLFSMNATFMVQNVFTITKYTGVDPEVPNGMDSSFYPRPRTFSLSLGFDF